MKWTNECMNAWMNEGRNEGIKKHRLNSKALGTTYKIQHEADRV